MWVVLPWYRNFARDRSSRNHADMHRNDNTPNETGGRPHLPVLAAELCDLVGPRRGDTIVDGTFGAGGHARVLAHELEGLGVYYSVDRDHSVEPYVLATRDAIAPVKLTHSSATFPDGFAELTAAGVSADIVILDIGVSSMQLDQSSRGFAYAHEAPLDMRMDQSSGRTASDIVNEAPETELVRIFREYGEERFARRIAAAIVRRRDEARLNSTGELVSLILAAIPASARRNDSGHPARRVFQALRIEVNDELGMLDRGLDAARQLLAPGGRLAVITFHSLEDRMVKQRFAEWVRSCVCPPELPVCMCGTVVEHELLNRKPILATESEIAANPRSASAKLRGIRRLEVGS